MAEGCEPREEERSKNTQTIKDAQDAQTAVAQALTVLKEFCAEAEEAAALATLFDLECEDAVRRVISFL